MNTIFVRVKRKLTYGWDLLRWFTAKALVPLVKNRPQYQHLWLLAERGTDARDNGLHLLRYIRREHPECNLYYVISRDSKDREKVENLGPLIDYRSFRHFLALAAAEVMVSTHIMGFAPDMYLFKVLDKKFPLKGVKAFLQHGIIKDALVYLYGDSVSLDLFVCGAKKEWEYVDSTFGHPGGVVRYLGLCRYDRLPTQLREVPNREILVMPTWRLYITEGGQPFQESGFYQHYQALLDSPRLKALLEKQNATLTFYPHHEMLPYLHHFRTDHPSIALARPEKLDVQDALIRADVLVTDYSSVFFDFAYMGKPVVYYQFDQERFRATQYGEGYFAYGRDGFGPLAPDADALVAALEQILENGCRRREEYERRAAAFFQMRDQDNCRRNYQAILDCQKRRESQ